MRTKDRMASRDPFVVLMHEQVYDVLVLIRLNDVQKVSSFLERPKLSHLLLINERLTSTAPANKNSIYVRCPYCSHEEMYRNC